jgi:hypothetical protein
LLSKPVGDAYRSQATVGGGGVGFVGTVVVVPVVVVPVVVVPVAVVVGGGCDEVVVPFVVVVTPWQLLPGQDFPFELMATPAPNPVRTRSKTAAASCLRM